MKKRKLCMIFLLCLALMTLVAGCRSKETNDQGNQKGTAIYYTNNDVTKLIMKKEKCQSLKESDSKFQILLKKLQQTPKSDKIRSVIPKRIMINGVSVNTNIVEIDFFFNGYKRISENKDLICRAGIVYTLTQVKRINYVSFSISGEPMLDTDGTAIGALGRDSFVFGKLPMK